MWVLILLIPLLLIRSTTFQQNLLVFSTLMALLNYKLRRYGVREISEVGEQGVEHNVAIDRDSGLREARQLVALTRLLWYSRGGRSPLLLQAHKPIL